MSADFFERQDKARRVTGSLVFYFLLGLLGVSAVVSVVITMLVYFTLMFIPGMWRMEELHDPRMIFFWCAGATMLLIVVSSYWKIKSLQKGGAPALAEELGGRRIPPDTTNPMERRLLNVVDEMAIASGAPSPLVYLLDEEQGVNAFAAGYESFYSVIGVTRGCMEMLNRDELQGVIGHEFSHILNKDIQLNTRLIGMIHGITFIGLIGGKLFYASVGGRTLTDPGLSDRRSQVFLPGLVGGLVLMGLGFVGTLCGNLMKAAVCRQREYLADAAAVQFTRNPMGLSGALQVIGGYKQGSGVTSPYAEVVSHMFFSQGVERWFESLLSTHPPLEERILRIDPTWRAGFPEVGEAARTRNFEQAKSEILGLAAGLDAGQGVVGAQAAPGHFESEYVKHARWLIQSLPQEVSNAARSPQDAVALLYALLLSKDEKKCRLQLDYLLERVDLRTHDLALELSPLVRGMKRAARLPLVDLAIPALREMPRESYSGFRSNIKALIKADGRMSLFEWTLSKVLLRHLDPGFVGASPGGGRRVALPAVRTECAALLSALAYEGARDERHARKDFAAGAALFKNVRLELPPKNESGLGAVDKALKTLRFLGEDDVSLVMKACAAVISADHEITPNEGELLRGISDVLGRPMPPLLPGQHIEEVFGVK